MQNAIKTGQFPHENAVFGAMLFAQWTPSGRGRQAGKDVLQIEIVRRHPC
jgi:hypothetical protein